MGLSDAYARLNTWTELLRRGSARRLLVRQLDLRSIKDILGHADLKTIERYLHAQRESAVAEAATRAFQPVTFSYLRETLSNLRRRGYLVPAIEDFLSASQTRAAAVRNSQPLLARRARQWEVGGATA